MNNTSWHLSEKQKRVSTLCVGISLLACGIFLFLVACGVVEVEIKKVLLPSFVTALGLATVSSSYAQDNHLGIWLGWLVLTFGVAIFLGQLLESGYSKILFVFVSSPAVASTITVFKTRQYAVNFKIMAVFFGAGLVALLSAYFDKALVLSFGLIVLALAIIFSAFLRNKEYK